MTKRRISLGAVTKTERQRAVDGVHDAVRDAGGWIDDLHFYSNISVAIRCSIPFISAARFGNDLRNLGLRFDAEGIEALEWVGAESDAAGELLCLLQITFFHDEPDLRQHILDVPG
jgi:hypothetical protein